MDQIVITHKDFFFCYDIRLSEFLIRKGFNFVTYAIHPKSHKTFYMFHRQDGLEETIIDFKSSRSVKVESTTGLF